MSFRPALALLSAMFPLALAVPTAASAQATTLPTFNLQRLELDPAALGSLVVGTGRTLPAGMVRVAVQGHYENLPFKFQTRWEPSDGAGLVENRLTMDVTAAIGVLDWLQVDAEVPFIVSQGGKEHLTYAPPNGSGLGAPWVGVRAALMRQEQGFQMALDVSGALPVGSEKLLARDRYALHPSLQLGYLGDTWQLGGEAGVLLREKRDLAPVSAEGKDVIGHELRLGATVTSRAGETTRGELSMLVGVPLGGGRVGAELLIAIRRHALPWLDLYVLGGPGVGAAMDTPTFRFIAGASFSTSKVD
ncbi:flagellar motor protein MotB [Myxococcus stipitatus]|uniref:flagellar motor protein MotB n=1 Tax=Myxococcus stipitatus TaxID=83455 RepID=UPI0030CE80B1